MNDVKVPQRYVAHVGRPALVPEQEDAGPVAPEDGILDCDPFDVAVGAAQVEPLERDAIIVAADEAVCDQHFL